MKCKRKSRRLLAQFTMALLVRPHVQNLALTMIFTVSTLCSLRQEEAMSDRQRPMSKAGFGGLLIEALNIPEICLKANVNRWSRDGLHWAGGMLWRLS